MKKKFKNSDLNRHLALVQRKLAAVVRTKRNLDQRIVVPRVRGPDLRKPAHMVLVVAGKVGALHGHRYFVVGLAVRRLEDEVGGYIVSLE